MNIDWSKAPESASHRDAGGNWLRFKNNQWYQWTTNDCGYWFTIGKHNLQKPITQRRLEPKAWTDEGLPPVGTDCEYRVGQGPWFECNIRYITKPYHDCPVEVVMFSPHLKGEQIGIIGDGEGEVSFRPIRTPEQIAQQERQAAIEEMDAVFSSNFEGHRKDGLQALYDAGYRKQVTP